MRETTVQVTTRVACDRCGVQADNTMTHTMTDSQVPILSMREATCHTAREGFTAARIGQGSPLLDLCEPCLRLVQTALAPTHERGPIKEEDDR